ncbi:uncharacterized protein LOC131014870 [Salvia miltiorrhiza]|uniref:uncharacterized protein LOC131014870 n=1 Tax=Salvia miltiorrhiza TaxID=226208 RepID=UPI0025AD2A42|nr:uncharacterized protein LOC131014870 [Salvia miltiorrhiza]
MPPEPLPWDRRDFRKHDRSASNARAVAGGLGRGGPPKWRDQQQQQRHHRAPPPYHPQQRWYSDFRSPGQSKQGGWPMYSGDAGQGFMPFGSRCDRNLEDEDCQPFGSRGNGRHFRTDRGSFTRKDWKGPSWEAAAVHNSTGETITEVNKLRSIENTQPCHNRSSRSDCASHAPLGSISLSDQSQTESLSREKNDNTTDETTGKGEESEKENCLEPVEWKPLKWSRVGSLSSRSSCTSHPTSSKSPGRDSIEVLLEVKPKNVALDKSLSVDVSCVSSNAPAQSEETGSRKKPRLGWGEGLAKYEKKKVEGPEDGTTKSEPSLSAISTESPLSQSVNLLEKSPRIESLLECASPATPSSVACSYSPGVLEEKPVQDANLEFDATNVSCSPSIASQSHYGGSPINLQNLELESIANLSSLINELLQSNDACSAENGDTQRMSMNKLLVWKVDVLKALEMTESEIESLEIELKSSIAKPRICCFHPAGPRSLAGEQQSRPCEVLDTASRYGVGHVLSKDDDIDIPGSATSKFVDVLPAIFPSEKAEFSKGSRNLDVDKSCNLDKKFLKNVFSSSESHGYVNSHVLIGNTSHKDCNVDNIWGSILSSNRDVASRALEQLNKLLPEQCGFDGSVESIISSLPRISAVVKERFLKRKQFIQFKEKVLALKFKVFQHFWKEGRVVSIRTLQGKTRKKFDPSRNSQKRNRSRVSSYAGGCQTVPADEVINFVNNLLSQLAFKPYRNTLKMPALILDKHVKMSRFISNNGLVEDPCTVEKERSIMNPWAAEETEIFIEKLAAFGKDFMKIASFLDHKTVADCIEFYYKNHKSKWFVEARKNSGFIKQRKSQTTTYLVGSGKRRNREFNAASLDMLGAASVIAANIGNGMDVRQKCISRSSFGASSSCGGPRAADHLLKGSDSMNMENNERETEAADVLASICGSLSSETTSSSITSSIDLGDGYQDPSCPRITLCIKRPLTPEVTQDTDGECSDESCGQMNPTDWSDEEKSVFIQAVSSYGKDFGMVSQCVRTKSTNQCKVFFSKARKCLGLDLVQPGPGAASDDVDGGGSDIEDDCNMGTYSGIDNNSSECKMKENSPPPRKNSNHESEIVDTAPDFRIFKGNNGLGPLDSTTNELVLENSSILGGCGDDKPVTDVQDPQTAAVASNMESEQEIKEEVPDWSNEVGKGILVKASNGHCAEEKQCQVPVLPEDNLSIRDADSIDVNDTRCGISWKKFEPQLIGNVSHATVDAHSSTQTNQKSDVPKEADVGTCTAEKSCVSSLLQNGRLASVASSTIFSVPIKYKKTSNNTPLLPVEASGNDGTHLPSYSLSKSTGSSQILQGYPLSLQTMKGTNGDVSSASPNAPRRGENLNSDWRTDFSLQKCNEARQSNASFRPLERVRDRGTPPSCCSSAGDNLPRNGDVKLFGKILSSSQQNPVEQADDNSSSPNHRTKSLNLKVSSEQKDSAQSKFDYNSYAPPEKTAVRRFALWDGSRIQTTLIPPIPDSARLLAKYPSAFSNFALPSLCEPVDGASVFQSREMSSSNGVKQLQDDTLAEMQRRSASNAASGTSGVDVGGRGRMVFGGQYHSLTDPVAAIKMHYARMQGGNGVDGDDRWISSRDVGR